MLKRNLVLIKNVTKKDKKLEMGLLTAVKRAVMRVCKKNVLKRDNKFEEIIEQNRWYNVTNK